MRITASRAALYVDTDNVNGHLNGTLKVRQISGDLLEREATLPVLIVRCQMLLKSAGRHDVYSNVDLVEC